MPSENALRVLMADDRPDVLEALRLLLKGAGYKTEPADSPQAILRALDAREFDLILMDLNYARDTTSGAEGLDLLAQMNERGVETPVIVMTAWGSIDLAVEAMRRGACDFVQKPWDNDRLLATLDKQARAAADRRASKSRERNEIEIARGVQEKLFPRKPRQLVTLDYAGRCVPAREVGGDYYDFLELSPDSQGFILADVSGKGTAAALLMANLQGCLRSQIDAGAHHSPATLLRSVNRLFYDSTSPEHYATAFYGRYDDRTRRLDYVNCGHLPPLVIRANGAIERLEPCAVVLGAFRFWDCTEESLQLAPGDTVVIYSDGITESGIEDGEEFGDSRLLTVARAGSGSASELIDCVIDSARRYHPGSQTDDMTVVAMRAR